MFYSERKEDCELKCFIIFYILWNILFQHCRLHISYSLVGIKIVTGLDS